MSEIERDKPELDVASEPDHGFLSGGAETRRTEWLPPRRRPPTRARPVPPAQPIPVFSRRKLAVGALLIAVLAVWAAATSVGNVVAWLLALMAFAAIVLWIVEQFLTTAIKRHLYVLGFHWLSRAWWMRHR